MAFIPVQGVYNTVVNMSDERWRLKTPVFSPVYMPILNSGLVQLPNIIICCDPEHFF
ncbi:MAG: hypothetical protein P8X42_18455 [Calditrichaceae bacterium]